ncbi:MAG: hypothetical protein ACAI38_04480 [Myxococcota bacterium]|nr:hypothetical protein [Myxococcota bacterium]
MTVTNDLMTQEVAAQAIGLMSRNSSDRIASLQRIIAFGLEHGVHLDDIRDGIARQRGVTLAGSHDRAPIAWSDSSERDFCTAFDSIPRPEPRRTRQVFLLPPVEDSV